MQTNGIGGETDEGDRDRYKRGYRCGLSRNGTTDEQTEARTDAERAGGKMEGQKGEQTERKKQK